MPVPAERASWPPRPIFSSTLCTVVPRGISNSGMAFPTRMSEPGPETTVSPTVSPFGASMYRFSPSAYVISAIRAVRLGSYSMADTRPGTPNFSRRKSMRRYCRLWPPPRYRAVMWPLLLRPPVRRSGSTSDFSGVVFVIPSKSETDRNRVAGVTGLNCRMPMSALEHLDRVALFEGHDRFLPGRPPPDVAAQGATLGAHHERANVGHGDLEQRLDRRPDLRLGGVGVDPERILLAGRVGRRGLLGDHGPDDHAVQLRHRRPPAWRRPPRPAPAARSRPRRTRESRTPWRRRTA